MVDESDKSEEDKTPVEPPLTEMPLSEFLESVPPTKTVIAPDAITLVQVYNGKEAAIATPDIRLHCSHNHCNGVRFFRSLHRGFAVKQDHWLSGFLTYKCSNCNEVTKRFALVANASQNGVGSGRVYKYGEMPGFGPPTPSRLISLIGEDRELFLQGRKCEIQGLGVGAFAYYRRVVEDQKNRILGKIIDVAEAFSADPAKVEVLKAAIKEVQFKKAMESVKDAMPDALKLNGQNPLTLLHSALSKGVHELSDDECLKRAHAIRVVLGELSERLAQIMKEDAELKDAIKKLTHNK